MTERKQRINVMLTPETLKTLEESIPAYQRSEYIEGAIRERLGLPPMTKQAAQQGFAVYERSVDDGAGRQTVLVQDGKIISQSLGAKPGLHHSYTGNGNPEFIGQDVSTLRGKGFNRIRGQRVQDMEMDYLQGDE